MRKLMKLEDINGLIVEGVDITDDAVAIRFVGGRALVVLCECYEGEVEIVTDHRILCDWQVDELKLNTGEVYET